jgi:uncharacterized protein (DUF2461 family)
MAAPAFAAAAAGADITRPITVEGESLKRPPAGFDPEHPLIEDLKRKSFFATQEVEPELATSPRFVGEVEKAFVALVPMMRLLTEALGLSFELDA